MTQQYSGLRTFSDSFAVLVLPEYGVVHTTVISPRPTSMAGQCILIVIPLLPLLLGICVVSSLNASTKVSC